MSDPFTRKLTLASMFEAAGNNTNIYLPIFYLQKYPEYRNTYAAINGLLIIVCGLMSNILIGTIGDKFEKTYPKIKSRICMISTMLVIPIMILELGSHGNYWISQICHGFFILV